MPFLVGPDGSLVGPDATGYVGPESLATPEPVTATLGLPFDVGAVTATLVLPFDVIGPLITATVRLPFMVRGFASSTIILPFDVLGPVRATITLPFRVLATATTNEIQRIVSGGTVTSYVLHFEAETTGSITGTADAAAVLAALESLSAFAPGDLIVTGGPLNTTDLVIEFTGAYAGLDVSQISVTATGAVGADPIATTDMNGGPVTTGGLPVRGIPRLWKPLMVFDKAGAYQGSLSAFNVTNPPVRYLRSMRVTNEGAMTFNVSRHSPDADLVASDNLVYLQSPQGEKPWWGTMGHEVDARGILERPCKDPWTLLRDGPAIVLKEDVNDDTPATAVMAKVMALHNDLRAATGEIGWDLDLQGSRPFRGDIDFDADTLSCIDTILSRSRTEIAWDCRLDGNRLVPILRMRDRFDAGAGAAIFDGPDGNVTSGVQAIEDPTPLVFSIRLRGLTTDLAKCLPEWAQPFLKDVQPEVTVSVDPGPQYRNRQRLDESLDWGLSKRAQQAQCNAIVDWITGLYHSKLRAIHDIEGRPDHPGWAYLGPPDAFEPKSAGKDSFSRRAWRTRLQLVELNPGQPASAVMLSDGSSQLNLREWLVVQYSRQAGTQVVRTWAIESVAGIGLVRWTVGAGGTRLYHVSGGRVITWPPATVSSTQAYVDPYSVRIWVPAERRYRSMRRILNGPFALAGYIDASDGDNTFVDLGIDAGLSTTAGDGSSLIAKVYSFERLAIENYDPFRDGVGVLKSAPTVFFGALTTRPRWHLVSFNAGGGFRSTLLNGLPSASPGDSASIEIESILGAPDPDIDLDQFPATFAIDEGLDEEQVVIVSPGAMQGTEWVILRAQNGTAGVVHEPGATIRRLGAEEWDGFPWPAALLEWPEGRQWAEEELAELSKQRIDLDVHIAHFRADQLTIDYGSSHAISVVSEGKPGRWVGTGRAIGWSTDPGHTPGADDPTPPGGDTELVLEWDQ